VNFLAPAALAALALSIPVVVLYMLKSRRRRLEVPSVRMWEGEEEFVSASIPWQRLRITAALVMQLLAIAAFAFLLARPFFREETLLGPHTVMIIDSSGSMAMGGRLEAARAQATDLARDADEEQLISVVEAGSRARVLAAFSRDPAALEAAIASIQAGGGNADLEGAMRLARGLATPDRPTRTLLLTDGGIEGELAEPLTDARHLLFDAISDNVAIASFGTTGTGQGGTRMFLEIASFSGTREEVTAEITVDGLSAGTVRATLEPGGRAREVVAVDGGPGQVVQVRLLDNSDGLPLDDSATVVLQGGVELSAAVIGEGSVFLDALLDVVPGVRRAVGEAPEIVVLDRADATLVDRPAWIIAPAKPPPGITVTGRLENPVVTFQRPGEPILEGLDFSDVSIAEAQIVDAFGWLSLVEAGDVPLVLMGDVEGQRVIYFTFALNRSNLPVNVAFPILGARIIEWLAGSQAAVAATAPAGTPIDLTGPAGTTATVVRPDGSRTDLAAGTLRYEATAAPGAYLVEYHDDTETVVASTATARLFVAGESSGPSRLIATAAADDAAAGEVSLLREWAPLITALLLAIVLIEWWIAYGRPRPRRRSRSGEVAA
jgi:hypothetical protein